jgi:hypothetical protein
MPIELKHFAKGELLLTQEQAGRILRFFFPNQTLPPGDLTDDDIGFAQALLIEAVDRSTEEGYVEILFNNAFMKVPTDLSFVKDIAKEVGKKAVKNWFRHATGKDLANPQIYANVRVTLSNNFSTPWQERLQDGTLTY